MNPIFLQAFELPDGMLPTLITVGFVLFIIVFILSSAAKLYKRCPSNRILVVYGRSSGGSVAKCIHGGGRVIIPIVEDYEYLSLEPIQIEVPLQDALSIENIRVNVPSVFTVAISIEPEVMQNAAIRLLGLDTAQVKKQAEDIIFGQLRQVIASMNIEDINRDRDKFLQAIQSSVEPELRKIGLVLINVNITDITDESGYIEAIGQKAASEAIQKARGDVAEQLKLGEVRVAEAERDKQVSVADAGKTQEIGIRAAHREKSVRIAELDKEQQIGEQRAAFEREAQVSDAERQKRISVAEYEADAIKGEAESQAKVADAQAELMVKKSIAYQLGETRKKEAEAAVLEAQNRAMAKAALAEAEKIEAERRAELEAPAKAEKARIIVAAQAEAEKRKLEAEGEASAIFSLLEAEAKGQYEILARKGEGLREIINACGGADEAFKLLMLEHFDNLVEASAKAISNIKFDKVVVWENGGGNGQSSTSNFLQGLTGTLPPMMQVMKEIGGVEMPEYLAKMTSEVDSEKEETTGENGTNKSPVVARTSSSDVATPEPATDRLSSQLKEAPPQKESQPPLPKRKDPKPKRDQDS
ncbi:Inner membrane protein YqiK [Polystyrenella longa]|uniref:Inner membrane protein YqiK n=1 Tax=Polystyrenella longa TaxID=2528007 RepID=A0A518CMT7_9PLAN|nr:flotillin family protein [Polystyrenella longa]QDU80535.1 Inner membrane protein YqiK [Polystyrenella longa]